MLESTSLVTSRICVWNIVMTIVKYLWCTMAEAAAISSLTNISRSQESRAVLPLYSSYVYVVTPKAGGVFSIC